MDFSKIDYMKILSVGGTILATLIIGMILSKLLNRIEKKMRQDSGRIPNPMLIKFFVRGAKVILWIVVLMQCFSVAGLDTSSIVTVLAASGAAVALALQNSLSNLASGILMLFTKPFSKGDYVSVNGVEGSVESIDLLYTDLISADGKTIGIPNGQITGNAVINCSAQDKRRVEVKITVSYDSDTDTARKVMLDLASGTELFLETPELQCNVSDFTDYGAVITFWGWTATKDVMAAQNWMKNNLVKTLSEAGVSVAQPYAKIIKNREE